MKNKITRFFVILFLSAGLMIQASGCYGSFNLTKKLYTWNGTVGNKFANTAVMWVLFIIPAYEIVSLGDLVVFNVIEFWSGKNPIAMNNGETETQYVSENGTVYKITATKNRFEITVMTGEDEVKKANLYFNEEDRGWYISEGNELGLKIAEYDNASPDKLKLINPDNSTFTVNLNEAPPVH